MASILIPTLGADWIAAVSAGDRHIENAASRINDAVSAFGKAYSVDCDAPGCSALARDGASLAKHVVSHMAVAHSVWGVRLKEHLFDLVHSLQSNRVFVVALLGRAIIETAAVIVHLEGRPEARQPDEPENFFHAMLDDLHGTVGRGRYPWDDHLADSNAMKEHFDAYRAGEDPKISSERRAINILTMLQKLDKKFADRFADVARQSSNVGYEGSVRQVYGLLSDICHPAAGTGILLLRPGTRRGWVTVKATTSDFETRWLFSGPIAPLQLIPPVARVAYESLENLGRFALELGTRHG